MKKGKKKRKKGGKKWPHRKGKEFHRGEREVKMAQAKKNLYHDTKKRKNNPLLGKGGGTRVSARKKGPRSPKISLTTKKERKKQRGQGKSVLSAKREKGSSEKKGEEKKKKGEAQVVLQKREKGKTYSLGGGGKKVERNVSTLREKREKNIKGPGREKELIPTYVEKKEEVFSQEEKGRHVTTPPKRAITSQKNKEKEGKGGIHSTEEMGTNELKIWEKQEASLTFQLDSRGEKERGGPIC